MGAAEFERFSSEIEQEAVIIQRTLTPPGPETMRNSPAELFHASETCGKAVIVSNNHGWIQALEIKDDYGIGIEHGLRLHDQRQTCGSTHVRSLLDAGRTGHIVKRLRQAKHHGFHPELRATGKNFEELNAEESSEFAVSAYEVEMVE